MAARHVMAEHGAVYRAVINWTEVPGKGGTPHTEYEGPYGTPGAAQGRVTFWENSLRDFETGETRATGHVEQGVVTEWTPYLPAKKPRRKGGRA
ncbi:hypothetical protein SEA_GILGAMESH_21 [Streptomyces phage Gilgamesh]|uniref:Uncharacterized protein n=1 Tax=Streptomyces phage Gilgamesh TaxID=2599890 RepID=A0A5J6TQY4_9CAUD|nr:hypothetical protein QEH35_gp021 [Streptomyces phage Gilgamesh]QFG13213.1 hypothetical protein SEA_GILGAMESH_21 [Streptomyces phage Gilgamesh]